MGTYEDLLQRLRDEGLDSLADEFSEYSATKLRAKAAAFDEVAAERDQLKSRYAELVEFPEKEKALRKAGVDWDELRPLEVDRIKTLKMEGDTDEWCAKVIGEFRLPTKEVEGQGEGEAPPAAGVVQAAKTAPTTLVGTGTTLTVETVKEWPIDKKMQFAEENPEAWEALKRGESVKGIAFS